ncbi:MAG: SH3 domain-containing protein, partial [Anaerolineae bacterium]|nr:SH3 domain-containing protein [Anaerolineae bacterium]
MKTRQFLAFFVFGIILSACGPSVQERAKSILAGTAVAQTGTAVIEQAIAGMLTSSAPPPTLTATLTPTPLPTSIHTPSATPVPRAKVIVDIAHVRQGPETIYVTIATLEKGDEVEIVGRNEEGGWLLVKLEDGQQGWIDRDILYIIGAVDAIPIVEPPATPVLKVTLTIKSKLKTKLNFYIYYAAAETKNAKYEHYGVSPGDTISIPLSPGTYSFEWYYGQWKNACYKTMNVNYDIYWEANQ